MKRSLIAVTTGALGALGAAGLISATPAQAVSPCDATPPLTPARVACVTNEQIGTFADTANPANQIDQFLFTGTNDDGDKLGLVEQPGTFAKSVGDFFNGPRSPE